MRTRVANKTTPRKPSDRLKALRAGRPPGDRIIDAQGFSILQVKDGKQTWHINEGPAKAELMPRAPKRKAAASPVPPAETQTPDVTPLDKVIEYLARRDLGFKPTPEQAVEHITWRFLKDRGIL